MRKTCWVHIHMSEWMLLNLSGVNMLESTNFFSNSIFLDFDQFPAKVDINSSLLALFHSDIVGVWELEDEFIWSPVSDPSRSVGETLHLILS